MPTEVFRGRYTDENIIHQEMLKVFPTGGVRVMLERGRFFCVVPKKLSQEQRQTILNAIEAEHYARDMQNADVRY